MKHTWYVVSDHADENDEDRITSYGIAENRGGGDADAIIAHGMTWKRACDLSAAHNRALEALVGPEKTKKGR